MSTVQWLLSKLRGRAAADPPRPPNLFDLAAFDPSDPGFLLDPYPAYTALRHHGALRMASGAVVLSRHADIVEALANPALGNAPASYAVTHRRNAARFVSADLAGNILPFLDPPAHDLPRRVVAQAFHRHMKAHPPALAETADALAAGLQPGQTVDLIQAFATPFSLAVACDLLGFPRADGPQMRAWSEFFFYLFSRIPSVAAREEMDRRLTAFREHAAAHVADRRRVPCDDLTSALIAAWETDPALTPAQLVDTIILLFADAVENVDRGIAITVALTMADADIRQRLASDHEALGRAVEEALRMESPAQAIARVATTSSRAGGLEIEADRPVVLMLGAANRDPLVFDEPDRFRLDRASNVHLSFGKGRHSCIGGSLVRLETRAALTALITRHPRMRLADSRLHWLPRPGHRWLSRLDVDL